MTGTAAGNDTVIRDRAYAADYDNQALKTHWFGPDVVFGLTYEFVEPERSLLDLGIGSGLSSILFHRAGIRVYGLDASREILDVCAAKNFAFDLVQHDLRELPLPYPDGFFDYVVSVAVLNSFRELGPLFGDVSRILKPHGIFAFTVEEQKEGAEDSYAINPVEVAVKPDTETAVRLFRHSREYIAKLLGEGQFTLHKSLEFVAFEYPAEQKNVCFQAYIVQKEIAR